MNTKITILILGIIFLFGIGTTYGSDITIDVRKNFVFNTNDELVADRDLNSFSGIELRAAYKNIFLFFEPQNKNTIRWGGQDGSDFNVSGLGLGLEYQFELKDRFGINPWCKIGYYFTQSDMEDDQWTSTHGLGAYESLYAKQIEIVGLGVVVFDYYEFEMDAGYIGVSLGVDFEYVLYSRLFVLLGVGYSWGR